MADAFRWQGLFQDCSEPLFVLNRQRRLLFVNSAWETLTGWKLPQVRGRACRRYRTPEPSSLEALLNTLCPPPEVLEGRCLTTRRLSPLSSEPGFYWEIAFLPLAGPEGPLALLGTIKPLSPAITTAGAPLTDRLLGLRDRVVRQHTLEAIDTSTATGRRLAEQVRLARQGGGPVLLRGEPGTGKRWTARVIHCHGVSADRPFVSLDCRKLPGAVLERTLFGPAGWTEPGRAGTIYLREPQYLSREVQGKLVGWLGACDAEVAGSPLPHLLAGCSVEPQGEVTAGRLLSDLLCALEVLVIHLPPLRQRQAEFVPLVERVLARAAACWGQEVPRLTLETWEILRAATWPGNLAELYTVLRGSCQRIQDGYLGVEALPFYLRSSKTPPPQVLDLKATLNEVERRLIALALEQTQHNKAQAAERLSVWRAYLLRRMTALGMDSQDPM